MNCCFPSSPPKAPEETADTKSTSTSTSTLLEPIHIQGDEHEGTSTTTTENNEVVYPSLYNGHFSKLLIPYAQIQARTKAIATLLSQISSTSTEPLVLICILKGSCPFYGMLLNELSLLSTPYMIEFIRVKSYVGNESSGNVKLYHVDMPKSITGRHTIIVEDIVDTGTTLKAIMPKFYECQPKSVEVCTLLEKRFDHHHSNGTSCNGTSNGINGDDSKIVPKYVGFTVPDEFVIGFGLDYNEMYRDLRDIWVLGQKGIELGGYSDC